MQAVIGLFLTLVVVSHGLPTTHTTTTTTTASSSSSPAPPRDVPTPSSTVAPPPDGSTPSSVALATVSPSSRSHVDQVIVLPHEIHNDPDHPESAALLKVVYALQKENPVLKGLLVDHDIGSKFFLLKPKSAGKAISLKSLRGQFEGSGMDATKVSLGKGAHKKTFDKGSQKSPKSKDVAHSRQKRFIFGSLRNIALPLTIFHYLGFLPMRVPGLPYHVDPGLPDYTEYEPVNDLVYPDPPIRSRSSRYRQH